MIDGEEELETYLDEKGYTFEQIDRFKEEHLKDWNTAVGLIEDSVRMLLEEEGPKIIKENAYLVERHLKAPKVVPK